MTQRAKMIVCIYKTVSETNKCPTYENNSNNKLKYIEGKMHYTRTEALIIETTKLHKNYIKYPFTSLTSI